jgi:hypothetical protein
VLIVSSSLQPTCRITAIEPLKALEKIDSQLKWRFVRTDRVDLNHLNWAQVVWFIRDCGPSAQSVAIWAKAIGNAVIYDLDDNLGIIPVTTPLGKSAFSENIRRHIGQMVSLADSVGLTSDALIKDLSILNKVVRRHQYQIINEKYKKSVYLRIEARKNQSSKADSRILLVSPTLRPLDKGFISEILRNLVNENVNRKIQFVTFAKNQELDIDLKGKVDLKKKSSINKYSKYIRYLNSLENAIGIAFLQDTHFNRSKTQAKYRDFALAGIPGLYSNIPPYANSVKNAVTGLLIENDPKSWTQQITKLAEDNTMANSICANAFDDLEENYKFDSYLDHLQQTFSNLFLNEKRNKLKKKSVDFVLGPALRLVPYPENKQISKFVEDIANYNPNLVTSDSVPSVDRRIYSIVVKSCRDSANVYTNYLKVGCVIVHLKDCRCSNLEISAVNYSIYDLNDQSKLLLDAAQQVISGKLDLSPGSSDNFIELLVKRVQNLRSKTENRIELFLNEKRRY